MKTTKAYQTTSGQLFTNQEQYVRAELAEMLGKDHDGQPVEHIHAIVESLIAFGPTIAKLLVIKPRKKRGPNKPKVVA